MESKWPAYGFGNEDLIFLWLAKLQIKLHPMFLVIADVVGNMLLLLFFCPLSIEFYLMNLLGPPSVDYATTLDQWNVVNNQKKPWEIVF